MTIKTKQSNPFQRPAVEHRVGGTYGERRTQSTIPLPMARPQKTADNFKARRLGSNATPYKKALHDRLENGTLAKTPVKRPSDQAYLNFLAKVIDTPTPQTRKMPAMGAPVQPSKTRQS